MLLAESRKREWGQIPTPGPVAKYLCSLFDLTELASIEAPIRVLDPGSGAGALSLEMLNVLGGLDPLPNVEFHCVEVDPLLDGEVVARRFAELGIGGQLDWRKINFLDYEDEPATPHSGFHFVIMNPPYVRVVAGSADQQKMWKLGVRVPNMYAAFLVLGARKLAPGGQMVAVVPRSFCNGPQFRALRDELLALGSFELLHLIESRRALFADSDVLQETVVLRYRRGAERRSIEIRRSVDAKLGVHNAATMDYRNVVGVGADRSIVFPGTAIGLPEKPMMRPADEPALQVSTGPVVDFRNATHLSVDKAQRADEDWVPLVGAHHLANEQIEFPRLQSRFNYIQRTPETSKLIWPAGNYVAVRRFSPKEQAHRVVAVRLDEEDVTFSHGVAFENHLNVIHIDRHGLPPELCDQILSVLRSRESDDFLRALSGTTQINASDLRQVLAASGFRVRFKS